jgi:D-aminopeptidase
VRLWSLPIVAETWDGFLNDINGFHAQEQHVFAALSGASPGPFPEDWWNRDDLL